MAVPLETDLEEALAGTAWLGQALVVRSSSPLDDDGAMAGSFASYGEVRPAEVPRAVRGCWASVFAPGSLERLGRRSIEPGGVRLAVLIQRQLDPDAGGWARVRDGHVEVAATSGSPAPLLGGGVRGVRAVFRLDGEPRPKSGVPTLLEPLAAPLVGLARRAWEGLGADRLEWAFEGGKVLLLQLTRSEPVGHRPASAPPSGFEGRPYESLARLLATRRGPLADRLLTPWAAGLAPGFRPGDVRVEPAVSSSALLARIEGLADRLNAAAAGAAGLPVAELRAALLGGRGHGPAGPAWQLDGARLVMAEQILAGADAISVDLMARGLLSSRRAFWWQSRDWLAAATEAAQATSGARAQAGAPIAGLDRWGDLVEAVVRRNGRPQAGVPASDGRAVGRVTWVDDPSGADRVEPGDVLVATYPAPTLAPLLWDCVGLVTVSGSPAAHLCEVARSLHLPAVVAVDLGPDPGTVVSLDGSTGETWWWDP